LEGLPGKKKTTKRTTLLSQENKKKALRARLEKSWIMIMVCFEYRSCWQITAAATTPDEATLFGRRV
jgi:hypothetical protein